MLPIELEHITLVATSAYVQRKVHHPMCTTDYLLHLKRRWSAENKDISVPVTSKTSCKFQIPSAAKTEWFCVSLYIPETVLISAEGSEICSKFCIQIPGGTNKSDEIGMEFEKKKNSPRTVSFTLASPNLLFPDTSQSYIPLSLRVTCLNLTLLR